MSFKISIKHSDATHTSGTKYYGLVLINIFDSVAAQTYSRLYRIYGSVDKKTVTWKCDVGQGNNALSNFAQQEFEKLSKSKSRGGYTGIDKQRIVEYDDLGGILDFTAGEDIVIHALDKTLGQIIGNTEYKELVRYLEEDVLGGKSIRRNEEVIKAEQEALALALQQRQEYYGDMLGSW